MLGKDTITFPHILVSSFLTIKVRCTVLNFLIVPSYCCGTKLELMKLYKLSLYAVTNLASSSVIWFIWKGFLEEPKLFPK